MYNWLADLFDVDTSIVKGLRIEFGGIASCSFIQRGKIYILCITWTCFYCSFQDAFVNMFLVFTTTIRYRYEIKLF